MTTPPPLGDGGTGGTVGGGFHETWGPAATGSSYLPDIDAPAQIRGSEGEWYLSATITVADDTPHYAEVIGEGDAKRVKVVSNRSHLPYAHNIWLWWDSRLSGKSQRIPITPDTTISFVEEAELFGSHESVSGDDNCGPGTCGVFFALVDTNDNALIYRLQWPTDAEEHRESRRVEMFIEPENGVYSRNLYEDFATIPDFEPANATIQTMVFEIQPWDESTEELGWAAIDDIKVVQGAE